MPRIGMENSLPQIPIGSGAKESETQTYGRSSPQKIAFFETGIFDHLLHVGGARVLFRDKGAGINDDDSSLTRQHTRRR
eukprot:scaffold7227_cov160-Amphora_coffeaeformis.AAC.9